MPDQVSFGVSLYTGQHLNTSSNLRYQDAVVLAQASEAAGFDVFWVSEHHGFRDGYLPSPLVLLGALAVSTSTIKLASGVALGVLYNPIRLAEDSAVVDHLADGRLILGLGVGYLDSELKMYGIDRSERGRRLGETIEVLRLAWRGEPFSYEGQRLNLKSALVTPSPTRPEGIPIWLGGYAPSALRRAAAMADGHLVGRGQQDVVRTSADLIRAELGARRRGFSFGVNVTVVLTDERGHPESALTGFEAQQRAYERVQRDTDVYAGRIPNADATDALTLGSIEHYINARGNAEAICGILAGYLVDLADFDHVHLALRMIFPEPSIEDQVERIIAFGETVLNPLRALINQTPGVGSRK